MTSRVLGLVREQVVASLFGASNATDAYNVAFRIPNLLRDLFAEGAMSAAFVPTFTRRLATSGKPDAFRLANSVVTALVVVTLVLVALGVVFTEPLVRLLALGYADSPGAGAAHRAPHAHHAAFPHLHRGGRGVHGDAELARPLLRPRLRAGHVQRGEHRLRADAGAGDVVDWRPPASPASRSARWWAAPPSSRLQWPLLHREGYRFRPSLDWRDEGLRRVLLLMGPGTLGMAATQVNVFVNTRARDGRGHWRGVVAELRVPADVPADRPLRRVGGHGHAAGRLTACHVRTTTRRCGERSRAG